MRMRIVSLPIVICALALFITQSSGQTVALRQASLTSQGQEQSARLPANGNSLDTVANELELLRKSLQALNTRLREISEKLSPDSKPGDGSNDKQKSIALNMDLLARAEDRAGVLRRQLLELIEKENVVQKPPGAD